MARKAPGKSHREGISFKKLMRLFPDNATAEAWFAKERWPNGVNCPHCGSFNVQSGATTQPYRCREKECRKRFSVKTGTVMQSSNLDYQTWAIALYLALTNLKSVSSMKLHRDLEITQKSAWHLAHRLRKALSKNGGTVFSGPLEIDEAYFGGLRKNMSKSKRKGLKGRGAVDKTAVVGAKDRATNQVTAKVIEKADAKTLHGFVGEIAAKEATVYTDDHGAYQGLPFKHESVKHSVGEYVSGMAHTNGIESLWSMVKRAHKGTFHKISPKHLDRYVQEFAGRHNLREADTIDQMSATVQAMSGKRLTYRDLIEDNGLSNGARS